MRVVGVLFVVACAFLALVAAGPAGASENLTQNAKHITLQTDSQGRALVTYFQRGRTWHVFVSGAINARKPSRAVPQVQFKKDYSGGRGQWRRFKNSCKPYDGPKLAWFLAGCKASDGSYWALQMWQRSLPNVGYVPWLQTQKDWEVHISHWTGETAKLDAYADWTFGGSAHEVFGQATYAGKPVFGYDISRSGNPLDGYGRLIYLDTFNSAYGSGWKRENSFVAHNPSGMFCYAFQPHSTYGGYPHQRSAKLAGNGTKYRLTLHGPGVTPDVWTTVKGLPNYDATNPTLLALETQLTLKFKELVAATGDRTCSP